MKVQKRTNRIFLGLLFFFLALMMASGVPALPAGSMSLTAQAKDISDGWHGRKYYKDGKYLTGLQEIDGKYYYFGKKGNKKTSCWKKDEKGRRYYFNKNGVRVTGMKKINKKYYYFRPNGAQLTSDKTYGSYTYFIDADGYLEGYTKTTRAGKTRYYKPNGKRMTSTEARVMKTTQEAKGIVKSVTNKSDSRAKKLEKCFRWVMNHPYYLYDYSSNTKTWYCDYADDHFKRGRGDCRADACAIAFLAKAIGYKNVYICADYSYMPPHDCHCWCEIEGRVYDPLFAESKSFSKYYNGFYDHSGAGADLWKISSLKIS